MKPLRKLLFTAAIVPFAAMATPSDVGTANAGSGGAFIGGMVAGHVVGGFVRRDKERTEAAKYQAYRPQQPAYQQPAPQYQAAPPPQKSVEQRLKELEGLASRGFISKQEYQARRKAILDEI